ncbi:MAG: TRAP transporter substrate-binding protein [Candidatus Nezhaarchaeota archaeon]|nr:TRAP transporter substrate-binding protein [Candidatus Nezhaarchaeota archaeon]
MSEAKKGVERRVFLKYAAVGAVCAAVAGLGGYYGGYQSGYSAGFAAGRPPEVKPPEKITLKVANYFPAPAVQTWILEQFCRELKERTGGKVDYTYYPAGTLLKATEMFDGVIAGTADIVYSHIEYTPGRMPVTECLDLPHGYPSAWVGAQVATDFFNKFKPKEWEPVRVLWFNTSNPNVMITKRPVRKLEDLRGLVIRAPGRIGDTVSALGGTPAPIPMIEVYDAIAKGVLDGVNSPFETLKTFRFAEVAKYVTASWPVGNLYTFYVAMNKETYEKLKLMGVADIFDELCGEYKEKYALYWNMIDWEGYEFAKAQGVEIIDLPEAEIAKWREAAKPVFEKYVGEMVAKGYSEKEIRGWIDFIKERIEYWTKEQIRLRIPSPTGPPEMRLLI